MNGTALVEISNPRPPTKSKTKAKVIDRKPIAVGEPSLDTRHWMRETAKLLLARGHTYQESVELLRFYLMDVALLNSRQVKKEAAKKLGISREHVRIYHERGVEAVQQ